MRTIGWFYITSGLLLWYFSCLFLPEQSLPCYDRLHTLSQHKLLPQAASVRYSVIKTKVSNSGTAKFCAGPDSRLLTIPSSNTPSHCPLPNAIYPVPAMFSCKRPLNTLFCVSETHFSLLFIQLTHLYLFRTWLKCQLLKQNFFNLTDQDLF